MGSPPFAPVSTVVTAISLSWVSSSVAAAPIVAATLVAFVRMSPLLVEAQLISILLFIMFILVSCHDTVVSCFAVTISRHDFIVSRFAISLMWPSAPLPSRADVGGTISSGVESTLGGVEGSSGGVGGVPWVTWRAPLAAWRVSWAAWRISWSTCCRLPPLRRQTQEPPPCRSIGWSGRAGALGIWMRRWGLIVSGSRVVRASHRAGCRHRRSPLRRAYVPGR